MGTPPEVPDIETINKTSCHTSSCGVVSLTINNMAARKADDTFGMLLMTSLCIL